MKWKTNPQSKIGDIRTITKFAFFPTKCEDDCTHWLEFIKVRQILKINWSGCTRAYAFWDDIFDGNSVAELGIPIEITKREPLLPRPPIPKKGR